VQKNVTIDLQTRQPAIYVWPEQRIRTIADRRSRVPDVCVTLQDPGIDVFDTPPLIAIEILSKRDEMSDVLEKLDEYVAFGIPHIWVVDPRRKKAFTFEDGRLQEVEGKLTALAGGILLPLDAVFRGL